MGMVPPCTRVRTWLRVMLLIAARIAPFCAMPPAFMSRKKPPNSEMGVDRRCGYIMFHTEACSPSGGSMLLFGCLKRLTNISGLPPSFFLLPPPGATDSSSPPILVLCVGGGEGSCVMYSCHDEMVSKGQNNFFGSTGNLANSTAALMTVRNCFVQIKARPQNLPPPSSTRIPN